MGTTRRSSLVVGLVLIVLGVLFLFAQVIPGLFNFSAIYTPALVMFAIAFVLVLIGLLTRTPIMAVPACVVGGIGAIFYWQFTTGNFESWAYVWALIPGFVGVGLILAGLFEGKGGTVAGGLWLIVISLVLFAIFASFLGGLNFLGNYWPLLLVALGAILLVRALFSAGRSSRSVPPPAEQPWPSSPPGQGSWSAGSPTAVQEELPPAQPTGPVNHQPDAGLSGVEPAPGDPDDAGQSAI